MKKLIDLAESMMRPITYADAVDAIASCAAAADAEKTIKKLIRERAKEAIEAYDSNATELLAIAFPPPVYHLDEEWAGQKADNLAHEIYEFLRERELWVDVCIYFNNKRISTCYIHEDGRWEFAYNQKYFEQDDMNPLDYFDYVNREHILSMSFEGPLYEVLNGEYGQVGNTYMKEFYELLERHGLHYELGNAWNLTVYKE